MMKPPASWVESWIGSWRNGWIEKGHVSRVHPERCQTVLPSFLQSRNAGTTSEWSMDRIAKFSILTLIVIGLMLGLLACTTSTPPDLSGIDEISPEPPDETEVESGALNETQLQRVAPQSIALLTYVEGEMIVQVPRTGDGQPTPVPAQIEAAGGAPVFDILRYGTTINVIGSATIVCYNNTVYKVQDRTNVVITGEACFQPTPLPHDAPGGDIIPGDDDSLILTDVTLEEEADYGRVPIILSPRNTRLMASPPLIRWVEQADATTYRLSLTNAPDAPTVVVQAADVTCMEEPITAPYRVCEHPWPPTWSVPTDEGIFLTVAGRASLPSPWIASERSRLVVVGEETQERITRDIERVMALVPDPSTQNILIAGIYRQAQLYDEAIQRYRTESEAAASPLLYIRLGDLYRSIDLQRFALDAYERAAEVLAPQDDLLLRAALEFGLGAVRFTREDYVAAAEHLETSLALYEIVGTTEQIDTVRTHLEEVKARVR